MDAIDRESMPSGSLPTALDRPPRRYGASCDFCRRRKIKCDGRKPTCGNCAKTKSTCQYYAVARSTRRTPQLTSPTSGEDIQQEDIYMGDSIIGPETISLNTAIVSSSSSFRASPASAGAFYSERNTDLDMLCTSSTHTSAFLETGTLSAASTPSLYRSMHNTSFERQREHGSVPSESAAGRESTSFVVDSVPRSYGGSASANVISSSFRSTDLWVHHELMAKAAEGRHRERIDFAEGNMDCDGWPPDLVKHLLDLHWNRQHHAFLITYRPSFMRDMACNGPFFSKILLNAILYGVAKFSDRPGLQQPEINGGRGFLSRATTLLGSALLHPNITVVQALLLLCNSLGAQGSSTSAPILYLRIAITMIEELDLNQERSKDSPETIELKRRIVWAAFILDKIHSLYHGRSIKFPRHDVNVSYDLQDHYEELEEWSPYAYPGALRTYSTTAYSVSTWKALCELCINVEAIISKVYSGSSIAATARDHLVDLEERLQRWKFGLPAHLNADSRTTRQEPTPMIMSLYSLYDTAVILLHRPALESGRSDAQVAKKSWTACTNAAQSFTERLQSYRTTFTLRRAPYLISYATYVASTIHVRSIAAEKQFGTSSDVIRSEVALTVCLDALEEGAKINAGVKRAQSIISSLMRVFGVASGCDMLYKVTAPFVPDSQLSNTQTVRRTISANPWGGGLEARGMDTLADTSWFLGTEDPLIGYMYNEGLLEVAPGHNLTSGL